MLQWLCSECALLCKNDDAKSFRQTRKHFAFGLLDLAI